MKYYKLRSNIPEGKVIWFLIHGYSSDTIKEGETPEPPKLWYEELEK